MTAPHLLDTERVEVDAVNFWARHRRLIVAVLVAVVLLLGIVTARLVNRDNETTTSPPSPEVVHVDPLQQAPTVEPPAAPLDQMTDAESFTRRTAELLFEWGTMQFDARREIVETLVPVGDPTGESTPGLVADIETYLPADAAWTELQRYETRQWIEIRDVREPSTWHRVTQQAGDDVIMPGTVALTVRGTRHRTGVWEGRDVTSAHPVAFTVFAICAPTYQQCHLLRLSMLDNPLP